MKNNNKNLNLKAKCQHTDDKHQKCVGRSEEALHLWSHHFCQPTLLTSCKKCGGSDENSHLLTKQTTSVPATPSKAYHSNNSIDASSSATIGSSGTSSKTVFQKPNIISFTCFRLQFVLKRTTLANFKLTTYVLISAQNNFRLSSSSVSRIVITSRCFPRNRGTISTVNANDRTTQQQQQQQQPSVQPQTQQSQQNYQQSQQQQEQPQQPSNSRPSTPKMARAAVASSATTSTTIMPPASGNSTTVSVTSNVTTATTTAAATAVKSPAHASTDNCSSRNCSNANNAGTATPTFTILIAIEKSSQMCVIDLICQSLRLLTRQIAYCEILAVCLEHNLLQQQEQKQKQQQQLVFSNNTAVSSCTNGENNESYIKEPQQQQQQLATQQQRQQNYTLKFISVNEVTTSVAPSQIPYGKLQGLHHHDARKWREFFIALEPFQRQCATAGHRLVAAMSDIRSADLQGLPTRRQLYAQHRALSRALMDSELHNLRKRGALQLARLQELAKETAVTIGAGACAGVGLLVVKIVIIYKMATTM
ncbi:unnamed protein product [Ceratitis capitata]|uniref:(Mediterranean fruit fly) hypothetical protein n=1 Tax=Ceratitis capitata TaxID=7213 RepID=A0A811V0V4_CERCA|nr:unnamed protein product [Ceratitis capitata]